ncbi:MAG TPA: hypothetical protein VFW65_29295 [Pseudonocardiaceae bacterium]|nr:hypothetical protein [Pseudonocardiaceae bacterium]
MPSISDAYPSCAQLEPFAVCSVSLDGTASFVTRRPTDINTVPPCTGDLAQARAWQQWQQRNAVDAGTYIITINLLVEQDVIVNVRNLDIVRDSQQTAPNGDVLTCAGGLETTYKVTVNLATNPPTLQYSCPTTCAGTDGFSINATQGDHITIEMFIMPGPNSLDTWHGSMDMSVGTKKSVLQFGTHELSDFGPTEPQYEIDDPDTPPYWVLVPSH